MRISKLFLSPPVLSTVLLTQCVSISLSLTHGAATYCTLLHIESGNWMTSRKVTPMNEPLGKRTHTHTHTHWQLACSNSVQGSLTSCRLKKSDCSRVDLMSHNLFKNGSCVCVCVCTHKHRSACTLYTYNVYVHVHVYPIM